MERAHSELLVIDIVFLSWSGVVWEKIGEILLFPRKQGAITKVPGRLWYHTRAKVSMRSAHCGNEKPLIPLRRSLFRFVENVAFSLKKRNFKYSSRYR